MRHKSGNKTAMYPDEPPLVYISYGFVAQLAEHSAVNRGVTGSIPVVPAVIVAEVEIAPDCESGRCGFDPRQSPKMLPSSNGRTLDL